MNPGKEAGKLGMFAVGVALMAWIARKLDKGWFGNIFFRGSDRK